MNDGGEPSGTSPAGSVRGRMALMLVMAAMPALIFSVVDGYRTYADRLRAVDAALVRDASVAAQHERDFLVTAQATVETLAALSGPERWDRPACDDRMAVFAKRAESVRVSMILDPSGHVRCASDRAADGVSYADDPRFRAFMDQPRFDIAPHDAGRISGAPVIVAQGPIWREGVLAGLVVISFDRRAIAGPSTLFRGDMPDTLRRVVVGSGGVLLAGASADDDGWLPAASVLASRLGLQPQLFTAASPDGELRAFAVIPMLEDRAWLVAGAAHDMLYGDVWLQTALPIITPVMMLLLAVAVSYVALDRLVIRHLDYLARLSRVYGRGRLELRPNPTRGAPAEIASLGEDMALMAQRLSSRERELRETADANRVLLMEVYHRVKNNLQMIVSLLNLQSRRARTELERSALAQIRARVHSLAVVHEKLYLSANLNHVQLDDLVREIIGHLVNLPPAPGGRLPVLETTLDPYVLPAERATPVALFMNEALTNAMKYGSAQGGSVAVSLRAAPDGGFTLSIANPSEAGAEAAEREDAARPGSIGVTLMESFARQLRGEFRREVGDGRHVAILVVPGPSLRAPA